jgi:hypothetical protein
MKITFETEDELIAFVRAAAMPWGDRLSPVAAVEFAITELDQFEFMRNDLLVRLEGQISRLEDLHHRMTKNLAEYEHSQRQLKAQEKKAIEEAKVAPQTQTSQ